MNKDYYKILELTKTSTDNEIKKNYRKLALKYHPDKGGDEKKFKEITEAYNVLGDPQKRRQYDNPVPQFRRVYRQPDFNSDTSNILRHLHTMNLNNNYPHHNNFHFKFHQNIKRGNCTLCSGTGTIKKIRISPGLRIEQTITCTRCHGSRNI